MFRVLFLIPLVFVVPPVPDLAVRWDGPEHRTLSVAVDTHSDTLAKCLDSGIEVQYRFELQACRQREGWFNYCRDKRTVIQSVQYDPITTSYKVNRDRLGDEVPESEDNLEDRAEALSAVSKLSELPVEYLTLGDLDLAQSDKAYLSVRVLADCRSEYSDTLMHLGYFITLGLVRVAAYNSGWIDFTLANKN